MVKSTAAGADPVPLPGPFPPGALGGDAGRTDAELPPPPPHAAGTRAKRQRPSRNAFDSARIEVNPSDKVIALDA
jgi:hypothetical protein